MSNDATEEKEWNTMTAETKLWIESTKKEASRLDRSGHRGLANLLMFSVAVVLSRVIADIDLQTLIWNLSKATLPKAEAKLSELEAELEAESADQA